MRWGRRIGVIYHSAQLMNDSITSAAVLALILKKKKSNRVRLCYRRSTSDATFFRLIKQQMPPLFKLNSWNVYIGVPLINLS